VKDASSSLPMTDLEGEFLQCESTIRPQGFTPDTKRLSYRPLHFAPLNSLSEGVARRVSRMVVRGPHEGLICVGPQSLGQEQGASPRMT
jgi:hypothetical protein